MLGLVDKTGVTGGCPIPRIVHGQSGWSLEQPGLVKDALAHTFKYLHKFLPAQTIL